MRSKQNKPLCFPEYEKRNLDKNLDQDKSQAR